MTTNCFRCITWWCALKNLLSGTVMSDLDKLLAEIRACRICAQHLALGPRPVLRVSATEKLLIIGQAPGTRVHESGVPWDDASGERLRDRLGMTAEVFLRRNPRRHHADGVLLSRPEAFGRGSPATAGMRAGLAFQGPGFHSGYRTNASGRRLCATALSWPGVRENHDRDGPGVARSPSRGGSDPASELADDRMATKNPWFEKEVVPELRRRIRRIVKG